MLWEGLREPLGVCVLLAVPLPVIDGVSDSLGVADPVSDGVWLGVWLRLCVCDGELVSVSVAEAVIVCDGVRD